MNWGATTKQFFMSLQEGISLIFEPEVNKVGNKRKNKNKTDVFVSLNSYYFIWIAGSSQFYFVISLPLSKSNYLRPWYFYFWACSFRINICSQLRLDPHKIWPLEDKVLIGFLWVCEQIHFWRIFIGLLPSRLWKRADWERVIAAFPKPLWWRRCRK